jgi:hypothetical protein
VYDPPDVVDAPAKALTRVAQLRQDPLGRVDPRRPDQNVDVTVAPQLTGLIQECSEPPPLEQQCVDAGLLECGKHLGGSRVDSSDRVPVARYDPGDERPQRLFSMV